MQQLFASLTETTRCACSRITTLYTNCRVASSYNTATLLLHTVAADISAGAPMPRSNYNHPACSRRCGRDLLCGHDCKEPCHGGTTCPPCSQPCKAACNHGRCKGRCTDPCQPCAELCAWRCPHQVWQSSADHCVMQKKLKTCKSFTSSVLAEVACALLVRACFALQSCQTIADLHTVIVSK